MATRRSSTPARETKMTSRKSETKAEGAASNAKPGMGFAEAVLILSALFMIAAVLVLDHHLGQDLAAGVFFKKP